MTGNLRVAIEIGPRGKKMVALAPDWPGFVRADTTEELAIERLLSYHPRYASVAKLAGLETDFAANTAVEVVERYPGTGSTDFWGVSFARTSFDLQPMSTDELERELALLRACWAFFDDARLRVSPEMRKGPRGGGRDRDLIARHTLGAELDYAKKVGVTPVPSTLLTEDGLRDYRIAFDAAIRAFHAEGKSARTWPLRFPIRHCAYHTLDHSWEMEDKDLTAESA